MTNPTSAQWTARPTNCAFLGCNSAVRKNGLKYPDQVKYHGNLIGTQVNCTAQSNGYQKVHAGLNGHANFHQAGIKCQRTQRAFKLAINIRHLRFH